MANSPVVQLRVPEQTLAALDEARGDVNRSQWIVSAIETVLGWISEPPPEPGRKRRSQGPPKADPEQVRAAAVYLRPGPDDCPHPKARVHGGLCGACGTGGLS